MTELIAALVAKYGASNVRDEVRTHGRVVVIARPRFSRPHETEITITIQPVDGRPILGSVVLKDAFYRNNTISLSSQLSNERIHP